MVFWFLVQSTYSAPCFWIPGLSCSSYLTVSPNYSYVFKAAGQVEPNHFPLIFFLFWIMVLFCVSSVPIHRLGSCLHQFWVLGIHSSAQTPAFSGCWVIDGCVCCVAQSLLVSLFLMCAFTGYCPPRLHVCTGFNMVLVIQLGRVLHRIMCPITSCWSALYLQVPLGLAGFQ